jgi:hypothetical protein
MDGGNQAGRWVVLPGVWWIPETRSWLFEPNLKARNHGPSRAEPGACGGVNVYERNSADPVLIIRA